MALDDSWMADADCRSLPDNRLYVFFPPQRRGRKTDSSEAKVICQTCPVQFTCLAYSLAHRIPWGVWGGLTNYERQNKLSKYQRDLIVANWFQRYPNVKRMKSQFPNLKIIHKDQEEVRVWATQ